MGASNHPGLAYAKGPPRVVATTTKRRAVKRMDRIEKESVRVRDKECCRVCGRKTRHVHERLFKSLGGVASLANSLCACLTCHPFLQQHGISVYGESCSALLRFEMQAAVAHLIFRGRAVPAHVHIIVADENQGENSVPKCRNL